MTKTIREHDTHLSARDPFPFPIPLSSVFRRVGVLRDADADADDDGIGGLMVAEDRVLSVLELVSELKREPASFLVIIARASHEGAEPCHSRGRRAREDGNRAVEQDGRKRVRVRSNETRWARHVGGDANNGEAKPGYG